MSEAFSELVRSADGTFVSVEIDDSLVGYLSAFGLILGVLGFIGSALGLIEGRYRVVVGINRGPRLETRSRGYKDWKAASDAATQLVEDVMTQGLTSVDAWKEI